MECNQLLVGGIDFFLKRSRGLFCVDVLFPPHMLFMSKLLDQIIIFGTKIFAFFVNLSKPPLKKGHSFRMGMLRDVDPLVKFVLGGNSVHLAT